MQVNGSDLRLEILKKPSAMANVLFAKGTILRHIPFPRTCPTTWIRGSLQIDAIFLKVCLKVPSKSVCQVLPGVHQVAASSEVQYLFKVSNERTKEYNFCYFTSASEMHKVLATSLMNICAQVSP